MSERTELPPTKQPEVGDVLMLHNQDSDDLLLCRVIAVVGGVWRAKHISCICGGYPHSSGAIWWGPDGNSWKSVTNLGNIQLEEAEDADDTV